MSANATSSNVSPPAPRWRLWVDSCGGFLLLGGQSWSVGGMSDKTSADICVRADWPRNAGRIEKSDNDYFWIGDGSGERKLIAGGEPIPIEGSAVATLEQPSPLCDSAVMTLKPPHRFDGHVDGVILMNETLLVGPGPDCHIRCRESSDRAIVTQRDGRWLVKAGLAGDFEDLCPGQRKTLRTLAMTLELA